MQTSRKSRFWPFAGNAMLLMGVSALAAVNWHLWTTKTDIRAIDSSARAVSSGGQSAANGVSASKQQTPQVYRETLARPLFRADRRPFVAEAPPPPAPPPAEEPPAAVVESPPPPAPTPPEGLKLVGLMRDGSGSGRALVRTAQSQSAAWLEIGDEIEGWRVAEIGSSKITLEREDTKVSLDLYPATAGAGTATP